MSERRNSAAQPSLLIAGAPLEHLIERATAQPDAWHIILIADRSASADLRRIALVQAAVPGIRITRMPSALTPLGLVILQEMAAQLPRHLDVGQFAQAVAWMQATITCYTVTNSVTKLDSPSPSMWQHLLSIAPGSRFAVVDNTSLIRVKGHPAHGIEPPAPPTVVAVGPLRHPRLQQARAAILRALGTDAPHERDCPPAPEWRGQAHAEICTSPADLTRFVNAASQLHQRCPWCGFRTPAEASCLLCRHTIDPRKGQIP